MWLLLVARSAFADPFRWPQLEGLGTPVVLSYSFVNLFSPEFAGIPELELRTATVEAFSAWSRYAPLHFVERPDSGPPPSDVNYLPDGHPDIRIGAHDIDDGFVLAHAFRPIATDVSGLAGDIHLNSSSLLEWGIQDGFPVVDFREVLTHEIGHALGLDHLIGMDSIMNPVFAFRFGRDRPVFLLPADIAAVQALYGEGVGSVQPIPEPSTLMLLTTGAILGLVRRSVARR